MDQPSPHDLARLADFRARLAEVDAGTRTSGFDDADTTEDTRTFFKRAASAIEVAWPNDRLLRAYQETDGAPSNAEAEAILVEIERRGLNI